MAHSTAVLMSTIRQALDEMEAPFAVAAWMEADADAGYLLARDGRMLGIGEYQHGFGHIDELADETLDGETRRAARMEAGRIVGHLEPVDLASLTEDNDEMGLLEIVPDLFFVDDQVAQDELDAGKVSIEQLVELLFNMPARRVLPGVSVHPHQLTATRDITVARLARQDDGSLAWATQVIAKAGETVQGYADPLGRYGLMGVEGGYVQLESGEFSAIIPPRPGCR